MPKISIVIPVKNGARSIQRAISSVQNQQDEQDFDLIVVDDHSHDETGEIIQAMDDPRVCYLGLENKTGANAARNLGVARTRAEIVTFLDADDELQRHALRNRISMMERHQNCVVALSSFVARKKTSTQQRVNTEQIMLPAQLQHSLMDYSLHIAGSGITVRRSALVDGMGWNEDLQRLQDRDVLLRLSQVGNTFVSSEVDWVKYDTEGSISGNQSAYLQAYARFIQANEDVALKYRSLVGKRVAQRLIVQCLAGRFGQMQADYRVNKSQPALGFSFMELFLCIMQSARHKKQPMSL